MQAIGHDSGNLSQICTKVGKEICVNVSILYTKFQPDPSMHLCFLAIFLSVQRDEKSKKKSEEI